ncbi:outer membrane beta-barrel protein [Fulvivirgaceae bacterium BMA10]|uniref:Outer membrane beta-barrel protein n=1 Tax=Splendidivirga corallicola TaxID=3051826 RepID=A0ABT8KRJ3_9BACT|nr:outer membrane beta-barrel protein [Fulvivirgaceae bacterium BMA10]
MQTFNFRNKLYLHWSKIVPLFLLFVLVGHQQLFSQVSREINLPNSDEKKIKYGFIMGIHSSNFRSTYDNSFATSSFDTLHSINAQNSAGFALGMFTNFRLAQYADLIVSVKFGFYENKLEYSYTNRETRTGLSEVTMLEFPVLFKYKSVRRGNARMYFVGGATPSFRPNDKKDLEAPENRILVEKTNLSVEFGFGVDLYFPLFRFSPEIRFSKGLVNVLKPDSNELSEGIRRLTTNSVTLYLQFGD